MRHIILYLYKFTGSVGPNWSKELCFAISSNQGKSL